MSPCTCALGFTPPQACNDTFGQIQQVLSYAIAQGKWPLATQMGQSVSVTGYADEFSLAALDFLVPGWANQLDTAVLRQLKTKYGSPPELPFSCQKAIPFLPPAVAGYMPYVIAGGGALLLALLLRRK